MPDYLGEKNRMALRSRQANTRTELAPAVDEPVKTRRTRGGTSHSEAKCGCDACSAVPKCQCTTFPARAGVAFAPGSRGALTLEHMRTRVPSPVAVLHLARVRVPMVPKRRRAIVGTTPLLKRVVNRTAGKAVAPPEGCLPEACLESVPSAILG